MLRKLTLALLLLNAIASVESFCPHSNNNVCRSGTTSSRLGRGVQRHVDGPYNQKSLRAGGATDIQTTEVNGAASGVASTDSLLKFSRDVKHVLHELRGMEFDPCIPKHLMGRPSSLSYSKTWTLDDWELHNSRKRYFRYLLNFSKSRLLRRILPQQCALMLWSILSVWVEGQFLYFKKPQIPLSALGTISTFVAFLLTLRSNHALSRLDEARRLWSKVVLNTREMGQLISAFIYPVDKQLALMLGRHVAIFGWLLKSQLRFVKRDDVVDLVRAMLPREDADYVLSQRQKTAAVITRIRQVLALLGKQHKLTTAEEIALDHTAHALSEAITSTGRYVSCEKQFMSLWFFLL